MSPCAAAVLAAALVLGPFPAVASVQQIYATGGVGSSSAMLAGEDPPREFVAELGLKPPTEGRPQIMLNRQSAGAPDPKTATSRKLMFGGAPDPGQANARKPILQGLVYFPERAPSESAAPVDPQLKQPMDYYTDVLVLTVVSTARLDGPVLAGAKFPVASIRFPFSFQMYKENLLTRTPGVQNIWDDIADNGDVIVRAQICPGDVSTYPCDKTETKKGAEGIAKIITNLPGMEEGTTIRAPASLPLQ